MRLEPGRQAGLMTLNQGFVSLSGVEGSSFANGVAGNSLLKLDYERVS
ncbi:hypothetical protein [Algoriphagus sp.]